jgi:hypothetical protein
LPQGRFDTIADSRTFVPEEQPDRLASIVHDFLTDRRPTATVA